MISDKTIELNAIYYDNIPEELVLRRLKARGAKIVISNASNVVSFRVKVSDLAKIYAQPEFYYFEEKEKPSEPEGTVDRTGHRSNVLSTNYNGGLKFDGTGMTVMLQDNSLLDNHIDYKGRFTNNPGFNQTGDHGEHCGGIIAAAGNLDPRGKGMAIGADVLVYSPNNNNYNDVPGLVISDDLTTGGKKGNVPYGTLATISESPFQFGLIYTGSDDGLIHVTKDGGNSWKNITGNLPKNLWVSRVIASKFKKDRVYATLNGYRSDDFTSYVYMSDNYGATWKNIGNNIPNSAVNVIKEDSKNEKLLYVGTDNGLYVTFNNGGSWHPFSNGIPNVAVHDLVIQERENDLVVGTHGRSIYKTNISKLQDFDTYSSKSTHMFKIASLRSSSRWGSSWSQFSPVNTPKATIDVFSNSAKKATITVSSKNVVVNTISVKLDKGFNAVSYDVSFSKKGKKAFERANKKKKLKAGQNGVYYLPKGKYTVSINGAKQTLQIK